MPKQAKSTRPAKPAVDVLVSGGGTLYVFTAMTQRAKDWVSASIDPEEGFNPQLPNVVYVEARYAFDLAQGMQRSGLVVR